MFAAIEDVHHRHGKRARVWPAKVAIERQPRRLGRRSGDRERDAENGVRAQPSLVLAAVEIAHRAIDSDLVERIEANDRFGERFVDVPDRDLDAFAAVAGGVVVTQLDRLVRSGRGAGGHTRDAALSADERDLHLQGWVASRIENLPAPHRFNRGIHPLVPSSMPRRLDTGDAGIAPTAARRQFTRACLTIHRMV
ncbi:MAG: putative phosphopyruvate hydratase [Thermomicrobiales bacterium]|nr:putative phosphopyruvate hydratase [Thermomicrobiales bacterium]